jgi:hypothetical protein
MITKIPSELQILKLNETFIIEKTLKENKLEDGNCLVLLVLKKDFEDNIIVEENNFFCGKFNTK